MSRPEIVLVVLLFQGVTLFLNYEKTCYCLLLAILLWRMRLLYQNRYGLKIMNPYFNGEIVTFFFNYLVDFNLCC